MMAAFDPSAPPFYELRRGNGPVMKAMRERDKLFDEHQMRRIRRLDPTYVDEDNDDRLADEKPLRYDDMTYAERKARGLCTSCTRESEDGACRCLRCRERYHLNRRGRQRQWPKKGRPS